MTRLDPVPMAIARELQGWPVVPKVTYTVPLQIRTERGREDVIERAFSVLAIEEEDQAPGHPVRCCWDRCGK